MNRLIFYLRNPIHDYILLDFVEKIDIFRDFLFLEFAIFFMILWNSLISTTTELHNSISKLSADFEAQNTTTKTENVQPSVTPKTT